MIKRLAIAIALLLLVAGDALALPAFPGAEGHGSTTIGGRGGTVIRVTNLNDSGAGSLRAAITTSGARIIVFTVGGTITLSSTLRINIPYVTIAGQTAPGGGIQVKGAQVQVTTHDVIMRGMRIRTDSTHALELNADMGGGDVYNCIFDHNSFAYGKDENVTSFTNSQTSFVQTIEDVTFSWNIIGPPLYNCSTCEANHASGFLNNPWMGAMSFHHNYFTNNQIRNPIVEGPSSTEWTNNYFYNFAHEGARLYWGAIFVKNHWEAGPNTSIGYAIRLNTTGNPQGGNMQADTVYLANNLGPGRLTDTGNEWSLVSGGSNETYRTDTVPWAKWGVTEDAVTSVKGLVLEGAGAIAPTRDTLDEEMVNDALNGTGSYISVPYWPTLSAGTAPTDTDSDGVPDYYETILGSNPAVADAGSDTDSDGYSNIEEYANSFFASPPDVGADTLPPYTSTFSPADGATGVAQGTTSVSFHILDDVAVDNTTVAVNCGAFGGTTGITGSADDYTVTQSGLSLNYEDAVVCYINATDNSGNVMPQVTYNFTVAADPTPALAVTTTTLPGGTVGVSYSQTLAATGGVSDYEWTVSAGSLPAGALLSTVGDISGVPTAAGTASFTVQVSDSDSPANTDTKALSIVIAPAAPTGQTTTTITGFADTYVNHNTTPDTNFSTATTIFIYQNPAGNVVNRILDNVSLATIPANVSITSATLRYYKTSHSGGGGSNPARIYAYRVTGTVPVITTVTGNTYAGTQTQESYTDVTLTNGWFEWNVLGAAQAAYDAGTPLYVALDLGSGGLAGTSRIFAATDHATEAWRPQLVVTYTQLSGPAPAPSAPTPGKMKFRSGTKGRWRRFR